MQVEGLRPGRFYAARLLVTPVVQMVGVEPLVMEPTASELLVFRTVPTPPGQMQPPALAQRARNALKVRT